MSMLGYSVLFDGNRKRQLNFRKQDLVTSLTQIYSTLSYGKITIFRRNLPCLIQQQQKNTLLEPKMSALKRGGVVIWQCWTDSW